MKAAKLFRTVVPALLLATLGGFAAPALGQSPTYTIPQTVQQTLATNQACTGAAIQFRVKNLGQTQHFATFNSTSTTQADVVIIGQDILGNFVKISENANAPATVGYTSVITGSGYFPRVFVQVTCAIGGTFSLAYSGASSTPIPFSGGYQIPQVDKLLFQSQPANANISSILNNQPPYSSTNGVMVFSYTTASVAGSTLTVTCSTLAGLTTFSQVFPVANVLTTQQFPVGANNCPFYQVTYTSGGATAGTFTLDYLFSLPGTVTGSAGSNVNLSQVGGSAISLGQKTMANSLPVAIASDQSSLNVKGPDAPGAVPTVNPVQVGGFDGTNIQRLRTNSTGNIVLAGASQNNPDGFSNTQTYPLGNTGAQLVINNLPYLFNGSTWDRNFYCNKNVTIGPITTATTTQLIAGVASQKVRICALIFANTAAATNNGTVKIVEGTGATCGTGTATLSATLFLGDSTLADSNVTWSFGNGAPLINATAANNICVTSTVTNTPSITVTAVYEQH